MASEPTQAQRDALAFLALSEASEWQHRELVPARGKKPIEFSGGDLVEYYRRRSASQYYRADDGWRRAGGSMLARLADKGFVEMVRFAYGVPQYKLTEKGRNAVA